MDYREANQLKNKSLLSLIAKKKFQEGQGLGSSIKGAISDKFKAKTTRFKQKLDPLHWLSSMVGKGVFGKSVTTVAGRAFGRSEQDIGYFGGYSRGKKYKKDPRRTTFGAGPIKALRVGDSSADILGKMYNFVQKTHEEEKKRYETEKLFREEQMEEDERRHKKLIEEILKPKKEKSDLPKEEEKEPSWISSLMSSMKSLLEGLLAKFSLSSIFKKLAKITKFIENLGKTFSKVVNKLMLRWLISSGLGMILTALSPFITAAAVAAAAYFSFLYYDKIRRAAGFTSSLQHENETAIKSLNKPKETPNNLDQNYTEDAAKNIKEGKYKVYSDVPIIGSNNRKSEMVFSDEESKKLIEYHTALSALYGKIGEMKKGRYSDEEYKKIENKIDELELGIAKIQNESLKRINKNNPRMETGRFGGYDYKTAKEDVSDTLTRLNKGEVGKNNSETLLNKGIDELKDVYKDLKELVNPNSKLPTLDELMQKEGINPEDSTVTIQGQNNIGTGAPKTYNNDSLFARIDNKTMRKTHFQQISLV